jgi:hypothetical protein
MDDTTKVVACTIIVLTLIGSFLCALVLPGINDAAARHKVTPTPVPTITFTPTAIVNASPEPTVIANSSPNISNASPSIQADYDDYLRWRHDHNESLWTASPSITPLLTGDPAYENGVRIYDPKATPTPTVTPVPTADPMAGNYITPLRPEDSYLIPDNNLDSRLTGALAWDAEHSTSFSYVYQEDTPVVAMRFTSNVNYNIYKERINLKLERQTIFGGWQQVCYITWNESVMINKGKDLQQNEAVGSYVLYKNFTSVFTDGKIPKTYPVMGYPIDTAGRYRLQIWIFTPDNNGVEAQACWISKQFQIIERK